MSVEQVQLDRMHVLDDLCRNPECSRTRWHKLPTGYESVGSNEGTFTNDGAMQNHRARAGERCIFKRAAFEVCIVANGAIVANDRSELSRAMQDGAVLY